MKVREAFAAPWLAALTAWRAVAGEKAAPGAFRILLLHDVPPERHRPLADLLDNVARTRGFISPATALSRLAGDGRGVAAERHTPCLLSFDDGFASNRDVAETLLKPRGISAVFFVCPGLIDLAPEAQRTAVARQVHEGRVAPSALRPGKVLMDWDDLAGLTRAGHAVGGHSLMHRRLTDVRNAALEDEITGAAERLRQRLGAPADWFAYPFGDIDSIDTPALRVVGRYWRVCRSGVRGLNAPAMHRLALCADHVDLAATASWQKLVVAGGLDQRYATARRRLVAMATETGHAAAP